MQGYGKMDIHSRTPWTCNTKTLLLTADGEFENGFTVVMSRFGTSGYKYEFPF